MTKPASTTPRSEETQARELLAGLYGESATLDSTDAREFEAVRDALEDYMQEKPGDAMRARMRAAMVREAKESSVVAAPVGGILWVVDGDARQAVPLRSRSTVPPGSTVLVPRGTRGLLRFEDGTETMLAQETRLRVQKGASAARLERGRLYAWVQKQTAGRFSIETPEGNVAVLGTEFDLEVGPGHFDVVVVEGSVAVSRETDEKETTLGQHDALRRRAGSEARVERMSRLAVRRRTQWARQRGQSHMGLLWGVALLALALGIGWWAIQDRPETPVPTPSTTAAAAQPAASAAPYTAATNPPIPQGDFSFTPERSSAVRVATQKKIGNNWVPNSPEAFRTGWSAPDQNGVRTVEILSGDPNGRISFGVTSDGRLSGASFIGKEGVADGSSMRAVSFMSFEPSRFVPPANIGPGQSWTLNESNPIPGQPNAKTTAATQATYEGDVELNGRKYKRVRYGEVHTTSNLYLGQFRNSKMTTSRKINSMEIRRQGVVFVDAASNLPVRHEYAQTQTIQLQISIEEPGKQPVLRMMPKEMEESRGTIVMESGS